MTQNLLDDSSSGEESSASGTDALEINNDFAKRFEYNKKREELQKLEAKYGKTSKKRKRGDGHDAEEAGISSESSSDSEEEDEGELATMALDSEILATLNAIRSKDPRIYDPKTAFYAPIDDAEIVQQKSKDEKPLYLRDYHRKNLLGGLDPGDDEQRMTYEQEQANLKTDLIRAMDAAAAEHDSSDEERDELLVAKKVEKPAKSEGVLDVENADRNPETFLSNFMSSRAWVPTEKTSYQPLESDDEEHERMADEYEEAYNLRFEDPAKSNERLRTHARDMAARYSVRREDENARQRQRKEKKAQKEIEKQQSREEQARLKRLKVEEVEDRVKRVMEASGSKTSDLTLEDWAHFVDGEWDGADWEREMQKRFGNDYYAEHEQDLNAEVGKKKKPKKPKFDDDIDIGDIVPDFQTEEDMDFSLTDDEMPRQKKAKSRKQLKEEKKKESKQERRVVEQLVEERMKMELGGNLSGNTKTSSFRYRETSPSSFGLSARDILLADDSQLNQFAGLKKFAAFRDAERKAKDKKHLGKKARLRKWRKETFGYEEGLEQSELVPSVHEKMPLDTEGEAGDNNTRKGARKKRRQKKTKTTA